jgi:integrase
MKYIDLREKRGKASDKALSPDERKLLLETLTDDKNRQVLILGGFAGLRPTEICQCRFSWLEKGSFNNVEVLKINIPAEDRDSRNALKIWRTKTRKERTTYIFDSNLINEVYFWFKNNPKGLQISRVALHYRIKEYFCKVINKEKFSAHALRSSAQNYMRYEKVLPDNVIQIFLGHSDIRTTMKHYNSLTKASAESYLMGILKNNGN